MCTSKKFFTVNTVISNAAVERADTPSGAFTQISDYHRRYNITMA